MMKRMAFFICLMLSLNLSAGAVSVWQNSSQKGLFADNKAAAVNDIVTIIVVESTNAVNKASTKLSKDSSISGGVGTGYGIHGGRKHRDIDVETSRERGFQVRIAG